MTSPSFVLSLLFSFVFKILLCVLSLLIVLYSVPCCYTAYSLLSCACTSILFFGWVYLSLAGVIVVFVASWHFESLTVIEYLMYLLLKRVLFVEARARPGRVNCSDT